MTDEKKIRLLLIAFAAMSAANMALVIQNANRSAQQPSPEQIEQIAQKVVRDILKDKKLDCK